MSGYEKKPLRRSMSPLRAVLVVAAFVAGTLVALGSFSVAAANDEYVPYDPTYVPTDGYSPNYWYYFESVNDSVEDAAPTFLAQRATSPALAYGGPFSIEIQSAAQAGALGFGGTQSQADEVLGITTSAELAITGSSTQIAISLAFGLLASGGATLIASRERSGETRVNTGNSRAAADA